MIFVKSVRMVESPMITIVSAGPLKKAPWEVILGCCR